MWEFQLAHVVATDVRIILEPKDDKVPLEDIIRVRRCDEVVDSDELVRVFINLLLKVLC